MTLLIPDISHWQDHFDAAALAADRRYAGIILKATEGLHNVDVDFAPHLASAKQHGLWTGAYHFGIGQDPIEQSRHFVQIVERDNHGHTGGVALVLDLERNPQGSSMSDAQGAAFISETKRLVHQPVGLYASRSRVADLGQDFTWVADYGPSSFPSSTPKGVIWQYCDGADSNNGTSYPSSAPGIGHCDMSMTNLTRVALDKLGGVTLPQDFFAVVIRRKDGATILHVAKTGDNAADYKQYQFEEAQLFASGERDYYVTFKA